MDPKHIRKARADKGLPVFQDHYTSSSNKIGKAYNIEFVKGEARALVSITENKSDFFKEIADGTQSEISAGFNVFRYEDISEEGDTIRTLRAIDWEPTEISFVGVEADPDSGTRSAETEHEVIIQERSLNNNNQNTPIMKTAEEKARIKENNARIRAKREADQKRELESAKAEGIRVMQEITTEAKDLIAKSRFKDPDAVLDEVIKTKDITVEKARKMIFEKWAEEQSAAETRGAHSGKITVGTEQVEKAVRAIGDAFELRIDPSAEKDMKPEQVSTARDFRGYSMIEIAREFLNQTGVETRGMTKREIAQKVFDKVNNERAMAIGDFPTLLGATFERTLRKMYEMTEATYKPFVTRGTMPDFRETSRTQLSGLVGKFDEIPEGGEYKEATLIEAKETYKLVKYGKKIAFTWESMINDDLSAFTRVPKAIANEAAQKKSDLIYGLLAANANMYDGNALFSTEHGNLGSAGVPSETTLSAAREAMRKQKDLNGRFINVRATNLVCGPSLETTAQKLLQATIVATKTSDTNIFKGSLGLIVEPRIEDNTWYLFGNPSMVDIIEESFLEGEPELFTETKYGFDIDGMVMKARMVYAAKALDWRNAWKNPNA